MIKNKVSFKTQDQLVKEQTEQYGRPIITPDFLILSDLEINGQKIKWIDAKNFYGANTILIRKSINKQSYKYIKEYGTGTIIFSLGFSDALKFDNTLLLDYQSIDI